MLVSQHDNIVLLFVFSFTESVKLRVANPISKHGKPNRFQHYGRSDGSNTAIDTKKFDIL